MCLSITWRKEPLVGKWFLHDDGEEAQLPTYIEKYVCKLKEKDTPTHTHIQRNKLILTEHVKTNTTEECGGEAGEGTGLLQPIECREILLQVPLIISFNINYASSKKFRAVYKVHRMNRKPLSPSQPRNLFIVLELFSSSLSLKIHSWFSPTCSLFEI